MNKFTIDLKKGISYAKPYINKFSSNFDCVEFVMDDESLSGCTFAVVYSIDDNTGMSVDGGGNVTSETDSQNNVIKLTWLLGRDISCDDGVVLYQVVAYKTLDDKISAVWYSPQGRIVVGDSIDTTEYETLQIGSEPSLVSQFLLIANTNKNDIQSLNSRCDSIDQDISDIRQNISEIEQDVSSLEGETASLFEKTDINEQSILLNCQQISQLDSKLNTVDHGLENLKLTVYSNNDEIIRHDAKFEDVDTSISNINKNVSNMINKVAINKADISTNNDMIRETRNAVAKNNNDIIQNSNRINNLNNALNNNNNKIQTNSDNISSMAERIEKTVADLDNKVDKVEGMGLSEQNFTQSHKQLVESVPAKPGIITQGGGEVFNDYTSNVAKGRYTCARGKGTIAGGDFVYEINNIAFNGYDANVLIVNDEQSLSNIKVGDYISGEFAYDIDIGGYTEPGGTKTFAANVVGIEYEQVTLDRAIASSNLNAWIVTSSSVTGTRHNAQNVEGMYNTEDTDARYLHITGNGISENIRSNAFTVDKNGVAWFKGGISIGGSNQDEGSFISERLSFKSIFPQIELTVEQSVRSLTITQLDGKNLSDYGYKVMRILIENAPLETSGSNSEISVRLNKNTTQEHMGCNITAPSTFLNNASKQYWGGYINLDENLYISSHVAGTSSISRATTNMPISTASAMTYGNIETIYIQSAVTNIPAGTKIKIWLK